MWTREEAIWVIERLEPELAKVGAHCALAGSVAYKGKSDHDLDLIIYPHANAGMDYSTVEKPLLAFFKADKLYDAAGGSPYEEGRLILYLVTPKGKRVDFFFLE